MIIVFIVNGFIFCQSVSSADLKAVEELSGEDDDDEGRETRQVLVVVQFCLPGGRQLSGSGSTSGGGGGLGFLLDYSCEE